MDPAVVKGPLIRYRADLGKRNVKFDCPIEYPSIAAIRLIYDKVEVGGGITQWLGDGTLPRGYDTLFLC